MVHQIQKRTPAMLFSVVLGTVVLVTIGTFVWHWVENAQTVAIKVEEAKPWLALWRLALFLAIIGFWPRIVTVLGNRYSWSEEYCELVQAQRWRVTGWLVIIELVLVQGVVNRFVGYVVS